MRSTPPVSEERRGASEIHLEDQAIISEVDVFGKQGVGGFVAQVVANMRKPGMARGEFANQREGLSDGRMHGMRSVAQSVEDQMVEAAQKVFGGLRHGVEVGEISDGANAEAVDGDGAMLGGNRNYMRAKKFECAIDGVEFDLGNGTLDGWWRENVSESAAENRERVFGGENRDCGVLLQVEWANIVEAENVVGVRVRVKDGVEMIDAGLQGLRAEIGCRVDDHVAAMIRKQDGGARATVVGIF